MYALKYHEQILLSTSVRSTGVASLTHPVLFLMYAVIIPSKFDYKIFRFGQSQS